MSDKILSEIYYKVSGPGSYGGANVLLSEAKKYDKNIRLKDVKEWLKGQLVYTLHKSVRKKFKRNKVIVEKIDENFQADLVDMKQFSKENSGISFILTVIDVFSKYAWAIPLKNKSALTVTNSLESIIKERTPIKIQTDKGTEFVNTTFASLMKKYNINHFTTNNKDIKCSVIERFNKTLKGKMFKYFTKSGSRKYISILKDILQSYNSTQHSSIGMAPNEVTNQNEGYVFKKLYGVNTKRDILRKRKRPPIKPGEAVRQKYDFGPLDRGYYPNWTDEVFTVHKNISQHVKPLYKLKNSQNKVLGRRFYPEEIQSINRPDIYRIENIIKEKKIKGIKHYFVKWLNHQSTENSWVKAADVFNLKDI